LPARRASRYTAKVTHHPPVLFFCPAGRRVGLGHFVRCLALAEELATRAVPVEFVGDFGDLTWPADQLRARQILHAPLGRFDASALAARARERQAAAVVVDDYAPDEKFFAALADEPFAVLALDDEAVRALPVDVLVNQNFGAEALAYRARPDTVRLLGAPFALLRRSLIAVRERGANREHPPTATRVLIAMGGADPLGLAAVAVAALARTGLPLTVELLGLPAPALDLPERIKLVAQPPQDDVAAALLRANFAVAAAGSVAWELACLGVPTALVQTFANQGIVYENLIAARATLGLGQADGAESVAWADALAAPLASTEIRRRLGRAAAALIDGRGAARVADALLEAAQRKCR
jgi:spore coat polysaccharide biosynthesis predicted glycosyltransferase SpsG